MRHKPIGDIRKTVGLLLEDFYPEHSDFQIENFIIGAQGHIWAQYKQALRELDARRHSIESGAESLKRLSREEKKLSGRCWNPLARKKRAAMVEAIRKKIASERRSYRSKFREYYRFYKIALELKRAIGELTPARRRELEAESWADKARRMAQIDYLVAGAISRQTVEFIEHFPRHLRRRLLIEVAEPINLLGTADHGEDRPAKK